MVLLTLSIRAELGNVTDLAPEDPEHFTWLFRVQCSACHEEHAKEIGFNCKVSGSRAQANFVWRCPFCKRESSASFDQSKPFGRYTQDDSEARRFAPLARIECRGLELVDFNPRGIWRAKSASNESVFQVDLEDAQNAGEWTDYDEKAGTDVSVMAIESRFTR